MCYVCNYLLIGNTGDTSALDSGELSNSAEHSEFALNKFSNAIRWQPNKENQGIATISSTTDQSTKEINPSIHTSQDITIEGGYGEAGTTSSSNSIVTVHATDQKAEEGRNTATLTFRRTNTSGTLDIDYSLSGSALAGSDYEEIGSKLRFEDGQDSISVLINPISDSINDDNENIIATIEANNTYTVGEQSTAEIVIRDKGFIGHDGIYAPLSETFELSSKPDAEHTVYLNFFGGEYKGGGNWSLTQHLIRLKNTISMVIHPHSQILNGNKFRESGLALPKILPPLT